MKKIVIAIVMMLELTEIAAANPIDDIGVDRVAHAACSYVICDQLQHAGMNKFWASAATLAIGAAKEQWIDDHFDSGDFAADCAGVLFWQTKF